MRKINKIDENIAYSKSILNKLEITKDSNLYNDYLKIREICGVNTGYVGILTKIRFIDSIEDMDEIKSIFDVLKNSKIDINKLNKLTYNDILNIFYDEFKVKDNENYELYFQDDFYSYYKVKTYEGILEIGSPTWCLKTKKKWDEYTKLYDQQWVVIFKEYKNKLISPNNNYLDNYKNKKSYTRYGVSIKDVDDKNIRYLMYDDNNENVKFDISNHTSFGVINTIINLHSGVKKSYRDNFTGCVPIDGTRWLKINDLKSFCDRLRLSINKFNDSDENFVFFSYDQSILVFSINDNYLKCFIATNDVKINNFYINMEKSPFMNILENYVKTCDSNYYLGIKLKLNLITMEDIEKNKKFIKKVNDWLIFDDGSYYLIINTLENKKEINFYKYTLNGFVDSDEEVLCWHLRKDDLKPILNKKIKDYQIPVTNSFKLKSIKKFIDFKKNDK